MFVYTKGIASVAIIGQKYICLMNAKKEHLMKPSKASLTPRKKWASPSNGAVVIEKGIPVPDEARGRKRIWPFADMKIGDSFFLAGESAQCQRVLSNASKYYQRKNGTAFVTRSVEGGARVWCVAATEAS